MPADLGDDDGGFLGRVGLEERALEYFVDSQLA